RKQSRQNTPRIKPEELSAGPPPRLHGGQKSEIGAQNEIPERLQPEVGREKQSQGNCNAKENRQRRRPRARNKCSLRAKQKDDTKPCCQRPNRDRPYTWASVTQFRIHTSCHAFHCFSFHNCFSFHLWLTVILKVLFNNTCEMQVN